MRFHRLVHRRDFVAHVRLARGWIEDEQPRDMRAQRRADEPGHQATFSTVLPCIAGTTSRSSGSFLMQPRLRIVGRQVRRSRRAHVDAGRHRRAHLGHAQRAQRRLATAREHQVQATLDQLGARVVALDQRPIDLDARRNGEDVDRPTRRAEQASRSYTRGTSAGRSADPRSPRPAPRGAAGRSRPP